MASDAGEPGLRLGYACLNTLFESPARTTRLANATPERLRELLAANLDTLEAILRWNDANDIRVFRVSSNTVPLASHPRAGFPWREELGERFAELGDLMHGAGMRLSTPRGRTRCLPPPTRRSRPRRPGSSTTTGSS
jgi:UV DNA damage endonuclease